MDKSVNLRVLTLNCWGLYWPLSKDHEVRIKAIADRLKTGKYDVIMLQEVWIKNDYKYLCSELLKVFPFSHYFYSGVIGSGLCLFSRHTIFETFLHRFSCNGYPHSVMHGDWYGQKSIGMAQILVEGLKIHLYVTHTHSDYIYDLYPSHRTIQAYEISQFIKHTSGMCDAVIVGGDFNSDPEHNNMALIKANGNLKDAWSSQRVKPADCGATSDTPDSPYLDQKVKQLYPEGRRLDYLLFRNNAGYNVQCDKCWVDLKQVPEQEFHYSDHAAVVAEFSFKRNVTAMAPERDLKDAEATLSRAADILKRGLTSCNSTFNYNLAFFFVISICWFLASLIGLSLPTIIEVLLTLLLGFFLCRSFILCRMESNATKLVIHDIKHLLSTIHSASD